MRVGREPPDWRRFNRAMALAVQQLGVVTWGPWDDCRARVVRLHDVVAEVPDASTVHAHTWCELSLVSAGRIVYARHGRERLAELLVAERLVARGGTFAMPAGQRHGWRARGARGVITGYQLLLTGQSPAARAALARWAAQPDSAAWTLPPDPRPLALVAELHRLAVEGDDPARCCALIREHLRWALDRLGVRGAADGGPAQPADDALARVREHVLEHLAEPLPLAALARRAGCSPRHLNRRFTAAYGHPLHRFIIAERLERAGHALRWRDDPVAAIAHSVGYDDAGYFARLFRQRFGSGPQRWRERQRGTRATSRKSQR